jgi:hypothetical protein
VIGALFFVFLKTDDHRSDRPNDKIDESEA